MADKELTIRLKLDRSAAAAAAEKAALRSTVEAHKQAAREREADAKQMHKRLLTDEEVTQRAKQGLILHANRQRIASEQAVIKASKEGGLAATGSFLGMSAAMLAATTAAGSLRAVFEGVKDAAAKAYAESLRVTQTFGEERDQLRQLAALQGKPADESFTLGMKRFQAQTAMKFPEAIALQTEFYNAGAQFIDKNMAEPEARQLMAQAGALGTAKGLTPGVIGDLSGSLLGFKDYTAVGEGGSEQVLSLMNRMMAGLERGKGDTSRLVQDTTALMNMAFSEDKMKGIFQKPEDVVSLVSTMAESKPQEAEVYSRAALRALRDFGGEKAGPFLAGAGITPQTPFRESAEKMAAAMSAESQRDQVPIQDIVARYFPEEREKVALSTLISKGVGPKGTLQARTDYMAGLGLPEAEATITKFQTDPKGAGIPRLTQARQEEVESKEGALRGTFDALMKQSKVELREAHRIETTGSNISEWAKYLTDPAVLFRGGAREDTLAGGAAEILTRRARAGGLDTRGMMTRLTDEPTAERRDVAFGQEIQRMERAGINPLIDVLKTNTEVMKKNTEVMAQQNGAGRTPPPMAPPKPKVQPGR